MCMQIMPSRFVQFFLSYNTRSCSLSRFLLGSLSAFRSIKICLFSDLFFAVIYDSVFAWHFESENAFNNLELGQSVHTHTHICVLANVYTFF